MLGGLSSDQAATPVEDGCGLGLVTRLSSPYTSLPIAQRGHTESHEPH